jgi:hypothetical protein
MLGILKLDIDTCITLYLQLAPKIFPKEGFVFGSKPGKLLKGSKGTARFDGGELERTIKKLVVDKLDGAGEDTLLDMTETGDTESECKMQALPCLYF